MAEESLVSVPAEYLQKLEKKVERLYTFIEITEIISSTHDLDVLMNLVMERTKKEMEAEACSILFYNKATNKLEFEVALCEDDSTCTLLKKTITLDMGQGIAGWVAEKLEPIIIDDAASDTRFFSGVDQQTGFITKNLIALPLVGRTGLIGVAEIINHNRSSYDLEMLQLLCRQFAVAIENALLYRESIQRERLKQELEIAAVLQKSFLPESPYFSKGQVSLSAVNISAAKVGGDLYDFIEPVGGKVGVLIGDVSGKGVSAALYMAKIVSDFRYAARLQISPSPVLHELNSQLSRSPRGMFLTAVYMIIDTETGHAEASSAGHPPFLWLGGGQVRTVALPSGPPLGIIPSEYPSSSMQLDKGDRILLFTDGLFDAKNSSGSRIGMEDIVRFTENNYHEADLVGRLIDHIQDFATGADKADDVTIVEVKWGGLP